MEQTGLVLEGGGMRGLYTAGVLEYFMERKLFFPYVIGVSAGACMAASYLSRQPGRNKHVNTGLVNDPRYLSFRNLLFKRQLFGMDFLFDEIPNKVVPFDFDTFLGEKEQFLIGTTDCDTGEAVYYNKERHGKDILTIIRASSSLPFISPVVEFDGRKLLDGGITDPIPIRKAQQDGYQRNVVIMTKSEGFRRKPAKLRTLTRAMCRQYPKVADRLENRFEQYNDTLAYIQEEQANRSTYLIQPSIELPVSRIERKQERLVELYELGYHDGKKHEAQLLRWLNE